MNEMSIFENSEFGKIRCMTIENDPWFVGKDVADILGYQNGSRDINRHVEEEDRHKVMIFDGNQDKETIIINESGLYSLILSSKMPNAKKFKHWVTSEVLPSIRKHGAYIKDQDELSPAEIMARGLKAAESIIAEKQKQIETQTKVIEEYKPKVDYYDAVLDSSGLLNITQIAKEFGMTAAHMNELLHDVGIQYKAGKCWVPKQKYVDKGYMKSCTRLIGGRTTVQYRWTQKGREFIHRVMAKYGYSPIYSEESMLA